MTTLSARLNTLALTAREGRTRKPLDILGRRCWAAPERCIFGAKRAGALRSVFVG